MKQVRFYDEDNGAMHGGILTDNGDIICGCCGGLYEADEINNIEESTIKILEVYDTWVDLDEAICGDDLE